MTLTATFTPIPNHITPLQDVTCCTVPLGDRLALVGYRIEGDWQWLYTFDGRALVGPLRKLT